MKLIRVGPAGHERPGVLLEDGTRLDTTPFGADYDEAFFAGHGIGRLADWVAANAATADRHAAEARLGPPLCRPSKIICIGLNYRDHAAETHVEVPSEPVMFFKATSAIVGPYDSLVIPRGSTKTDWEVELAVVMGRKATYVSESDALQYVAGYVLHNDYSERAFQLERQGQWVKGKSCDTFAPLGPFLATADEVPDPQQLDLWLKVNGELRQQSNTSQMARSVAELIAYTSQFMSLLPGDIISTGTPGGVGAGMVPPTFLRPGDVVELGVQGLGTSRQEATAAC